jgi:putative flippase GtrA
MLGIVVHYGLSRALVFDAQASGKAEWRLFAEFVASGLAGLAATVACIWLAVDGLGLALLPAKIGAVAVSFIGVFLIRRFVVFRG